MNGLGYFEKDQEVKVCIFKKTHIVKKMHILAALHVAFDDSSGEAQMSLNLQADSGYGGSTQKCGHNPGTPTTYNQNSTLPVGFL